MDQRVHKHIAPACRTASEAHYAGMPAKRARTKLWLQARAHHLPAAVTYHGGAARDAHTILSKQTLPAREMPTMARGRDILATTFARAHAGS
jgi:hypothetical protein